MIISNNNINGVEVLIGENKHIKFVLAPALGGKILSVFNKELDKEFLWSNKNLHIQTYPQGSDYDANFWGGIDELIPNDIPENVDGNQYPDHGELWTTALDYEVHNQRISVFGLLKISGLYYKKTITLKEDSPEIVLEYTIKNTSAETRHFMWKLHAALAITQGDKLISSARKAKVVYPENSSYKSNHEFRWPIIDDCDASIVPPINDTLDFFYLYDIPKSEMHFIDANRTSQFSYYYDQNVFPYQWYFASYGKFLKHYTAILEPSSSMPVSVQESMAAKQCSILGIGEELNTVVTIYAGKNKITNE